MRMRREAILSGCFFSYVNQVVRIAVLFLLCFFFYIELPDCFSSVFMGISVAGLVYLSNCSPKKKGWFCGGWGLCKVSTSVPSHPTTKLATFGNYLSEYLLVLITADSYLFHNRWALQLSRGMMDELLWVG